MSAERVADVISDLPSRWRDRAQGCREIGDERGALMYTKLAEELEEALRDSDGALLTLAEASRRSGYSADHLARLIKQGALRDYGRKHAPLVRETELPKKPRSPALTAATNGRISKSQIARAVVSSPQEAKR